MTWHNVRITGTDVSSHALGGHATACPYNFCMLHDTRIKSFVNGIEENIDMTEASDS
mgnify:FL=1